MITLIKELTGAYGPSSREENIRELMKYILIPLETLWPLKKERARGLCWQPIWTK